MRIGVPKEIKNHEYRAGVTPDGVRTLNAAGHQVWVQTLLGERVGFPDTLYQAAGARIVARAEEIYACDMVIKVKELQPVEFALQHAGLILYCYQHFAPDPVLLAAALTYNITSVAYETVTAADGSLPLLTPMSQIAGRLAPQMGAWALQMINGGSGVLLGGVTGVLPAQVLIIGGGIVGASAARIALGMGADVTLVDHSAAKLARLEAVFGARLKTAISNVSNLEHLAAAADLIIGAVLVPGKLAPKLLHRTDLRRMRPGSVIVDVAIDQGGICETSRPTSHTAPIYVEDGVVHYCVPNMPSAVARTATLALTQATLPLALEIANKGLVQAIRDYPGLRDGVQTVNGKVTHAGLARDTGRPYTTFESALP